MIKGRPRHLLNQKDYNRFPTEPFSIGYESVPDLLRQSLGPLGGIQPVTGAMLKGAGGVLREMPSEPEIDLFRRSGTEFQLIMLVLSIAHLSERDGVPHAIPYALTLFPGSKRDAVDQRNIDAIAKLNIRKNLVETQPSYTGFDPFTGEWSMLSPLSLLVEKKFQGSLDEVGVVVEQYFLATTFDSSDVQEVPLGLVNPKAEEKYRKHRANLLYRPFAEVTQRRVWGVQSPIELFLFQELLRRGLSLEIQTLFFDDGSVHSSLYHLWKDIEFRHAPGMITEADFYIPSQKLAIFCDSRKFHRGVKAVAKDRAIDEKLAAIGIKSVRVPGPLIVKDLKAAADLVTSA